MPYCCASLVGSDNERKEQCVAVVCVCDGLACVWCVCVCACVCACVCVRSCTNIERQTDKFVKEAQELSVSQMIVGSGKKKRHQSASRALCMREIYRKLVLGFLSLLAR